MQKYKIVASKSQKKYTLIISADSESEAREKVHKEGYSILGSSEAKNTDIQGQKFIFQAGVEGAVKNGIILGKDIFKVYLKLRDELGYDIISLYPEGDEAHTNAEKKQKIIEQLEKGYKLQKQSKKKGISPKQQDEKFYIKKELDEVSRLIESVIAKLDTLLSEGAKYNIDQERLGKLQQLYNKLIHIKGSTNLSKLRQIGELALIKVGEIELQSLEKNKDEESGNLLEETNALLKKIGSDQHFVEKDKNIKLILSDFFRNLKESLSLKELKNSYGVKKQKKLIDTQSYGFLKTVLLLEKYKERLKENSHNVRKNIFTVMNPFYHSEKKDKILLTRRVIQQNISILKAKKTGSLSSYTGIKKGYHKITEKFFESMGYFGVVLLFGISLYCLMFFTSLLLATSGGIGEGINPKAVGMFLLLFFLFICVSFSKNFILTFLSIVFFVFIFIFSQVNF